MAFKRLVLCSAAQVQHRVKIRQFGRYKSVPGRNKFFDRATISASGGRGGDGCISFNGKSL